MNKTIEKRLNRYEVPADLTWNLDDLFLSDQEWEAALNEIEGDVKKFGSFKGSTYLT